MAAAKENHSVSIPMVQAGSLLHEPIRQPRFRVAMGPTQAVVGSLSVPAQPVTEGQIKTVHVSTLTNANKAHVTLEHGVSTHQGVSTAQTAHQASLAQA